MVGYGSGTSYKIYFPEGKTFTISNEVSFEENDFNWNCKEDPGHVHEVPLNKSFSNLQYISSEIEENGGNIPGNHPKYSNSSEQSFVDGLTYFPPEKRSFGRKTSKPELFQPDAYVALRDRLALGIIDTNLVDRYNEDMNHLEKQSWIEAIQTEMEDPKRSGVIELVPCPNDGKPISCRCTFGRKSNNSREI